MRCISPFRVGFQSDGTTLAWSHKTISLEYPTFQLPCGKCIECRLEYSRQWAVRCVHEAQMHKKNSFITLTYNDEKLPKDKKLHYSDFQKFMKRLRRLQDEPIGMFVTGEYGEKEKRPHWHAIIFNWEPGDKKYFRSNDRGDKIYSSELLDKTWGNGYTEVGGVTFESAGYCARYAAKKLVHGPDGSHDCNPISKKSSKHAIGKKWLEKHWSDIFNYGKCILRNGQETSIPRYYEKWLKENQPDEWLRYITEIKLQKISDAQKKTDKEHKEWLIRLMAKPFRHPLTPNEIRKIIVEDKFKKLQEHLKL